MKRTGRRTRPEQGLEGKRHGAMGRARWPKTRQWLEEAGRATRVRRTRTRRCVCVQQGVGTRGDDTHAPYVGLVGLERAVRVELTRSTRRFARGKVRDGPGRCEVVGAVVCR